MKKILTFSLVMMLMMVGVVSAVSGVNITNPEINDYVSGNLEVEWDNPQSVTLLTLQYKEVGGTWIDLTTIIGSTPTKYDWDTGEVDDGDYKLRLKLGEVTYAGPVKFTIDNTAPVADFEFSGTQVVGEEIIFDASDSSDDVEIYEWDFDNDGKIDEKGDIVTHVFSEEGDYNVALTVRDYAGNEDVETQEIEISGIETEEEEFSFEAGILGILDLDESFDTEISGVECEFVISDAPDGLVIGEDGSECTFDWADIPYEDRVTYDLIVKATLSDAKWYNVKLNVYTWMIELDEGWNLISIPMIPESTDIKDVLGEIKGNLASDYSVWSYQYDEDGENKWYKSKATWTGDLDDIVPGYAYWIKMENEDVLKGIGSINPGMGQTASTIVTNGWNLIGHYGLSEFPVSEALTSLKLGGTKYYDAVVTEDEKFYPYEGYWMTAKFLPNGITSYTPAQEVINIILGLIP